MKNCRAVAMALVLFMTVALSGCIGPDEPILTMPPGSQVPPGQKPAQMTVDVYWDATVSMRGFTTLAAGNVYRTLPDMLGELGGSLGEARLRFFRFGEQITPIEGREDYLRFRDQDCYTEKITSFGNVLDAADPNNLSVVITDLFEDKADWSNLTQKLREKYFSQHLAVAIIGIKNSFYGEIFDVGLNAANFSYNSGDDPVRFRPFYLFLMGSEPQVRTFMERWKEKMPSENIKYVVFSEYFATYVADMQNTTKENLVGDGHLTKADTRLQEVRVAESDKEAKFTLRGKLEKNNYCCLVNKNFEKPQVKVFAWVDTIVKGENIDNEKEGEKDEESGLLDKISAWFGKDENTDKDATNDKDESDDNDKAGEKDEESGLLDKISAWFGKDENAEKNANSNNDKDAYKNTEGEKGEWQEQECNGVTKVSFKWDDEVDRNGNNCTLGLTFQPGITLPWGQIGLIQVQAVPSREDLQLPEWILEWDMGDIDVARDQFDGAKTVNLERIASSLKDSLMATAHPTIAELYLVIDGRR